MTEFKYLEKASAKEVKDFFCFYHRDLISCEIAYQLKRIADLLENDRKRKVKR